MKIGTSILVAGAVLAIAVPSALGAVKAIPQDPSSPQQLAKATGSQHLVKGSPLGLNQAVAIKKLKQRNAVLAAKIKALAAKNASLSSANSSQLSQIIALNQQVWTLTPHPAPPPPDLDAECRDTQICTPEQDCRVYGNECDVVTPATPTDGESRENG